VDAFLSFLDLMRMGALVIFGLSLVFALVAGLWFKSTAPLRAAKRRQAVEAVRARNAAARAAVAVDDLP
jgi:hypothetical protein